MFVLLFCLTLISKLLSFSTCRNPKIDGILWSRNSANTTVYIFNHNFFWTYNLTDQKLGGIREVNNVWPHVVTPIDGVSEIGMNEASIFKNGYVIESQFEKYIIFITGNKFWIYNNEFTFKNNQKLINKGTVDIAVPIAMKNKGLNVIASAKDGKTSKLKLLIGYCYNDQLQVCPGEISSNSNGTAIRFGFNDVPAFNPIYTRCTNFSTFVVSRFCGASSLKTVSMVNYTFYLIMADEKELRLFTYIGKTKLSFQQFKSVKNLTILGDVYNCNVRPLLVYLLRNLQQAIIDGNPSALMTPLQSGIHKNVDNRSH
ncbi:hypothetical protein B4U80_13607 [Leptotrombidium deliense]|uniref:Uncharacterized protein n=1 Tax=Leptotrombidium deliense TaxID=299467 RepID=A0A443SU96_9ACAR|nr:hypothetical protein B4U80_13607 [Leptotrombidium deliense]